MQILSTPGFEDYQLIDSGNGRRLERYGVYILDRPDPSVIWKPKLGRSTWNKAVAVFENGWRLSQKIPDRWQMEWNNMRFWVKLTPFKHTGVFVEQVENWKWLSDKIQGSKLKGQELKVLNLFGYTGLSTIAATIAGGVVTHVDGSKPNLSWARENYELSGLSDKPVRWVLEDAVKYCKRELRRGSRYQAIIMDPPAFGHGPAGEKWDFGNNFPELLETCRRLLADKPTLLLINAYAVSQSGIGLGNALEGIFDQGKVECGELALVEASGRRLLSTGKFARWSN